MSDVERALRERDAAEPERHAGLVAELARRPSAAPMGERELIEAARAGDAAARAELVEAYLPHIAATARTYRSSASVSRMELVQEGVVGLLRALERFDPGRGVPFWAYAAWWVRQAMQQTVSELTGPVVLSDRALRALARVKDAHRALTAEQGAEPDVEALADRAGVDAERVADLVAVGRIPRSLDEPVGGEDGEIGAFGELLADPLAEDDYERVIDEIASAEIAELLRGLTDRERIVLSARFGFHGPERSLRDIGEDLGLSGERVRQIERRALGKLQAAAGA